MIMAEESDFLSQSAQAAHVRRGWEEMFRASAEESTLICDDLSTDWDECDWQW